MLAEQPHILLREKGRERGGIEAVAAPSPLFLWWIPDGGWRTEELLLPPGRGLGPAAEDKG